MEARDAGLDRERGHWKWTRMQPRSGNRNYCWVEKLDGGAPVPVGLSGEGE